MYTLATIGSLIFSDPDPQAIEWAKSLDSNCSRCVRAAPAVQDPGIYVLMSFSVPDQIWLSLSKELERVGGSFVLRGLPEQSFSALQRRIVELKKKGVNAQIQIHPRLFDDHQVDRAPAFLFIDEKGSDLVRGNVTLRYAAELRGMDD